MKQKLANLLLLKMLLVLTCLLMNGCAKLVVIPSDKEVVRIKAGEKASKDGYLVPDARMLEILDALGKKATE